MPDRLSMLDASFLYLEEPTTAMHVGSVGIFAAPAEGFDHEALVELIAERIAYVPRYRQRIRQVPGRIANPVWVDDEKFDVAYHVRRSALPRPGTTGQLADFVARIQSRRLDRQRPLWEVYLVEGLEQTGSDHSTRFAVVTKTHQAMVDGVAAVDIGQVILDSDPDPWEPPADTWHPAREPSSIELVAGALSDVIARPTALAETLRAGLGDITSTAARIAGGALAVARTAARSAPASPLNAVIGEQRRYAMVETSLDDYRRIRKAYGASVNDVVLTVVAGALRPWLQTRGARVTGATVVRALVPVSVQHTVPSSAAPDGAAVRRDGGFSVGNRVSSYLLDLPVGEPSPVMRLHQVAYQMQAHRDSGEAVGAEALTGIAGFAPPTLHSLGARVAGGLSKRLFNLVVTNVPGPQHPLYAGGARMLGAYPVMPLSKGQALAVGVSSYDGGVFYGLHGDRDALADLDLLAQFFDAALVELRETVR